MSPFSPPSPCIVYVKWHNKPQIRHTHAIMLKKTNFNLQSDSDERLKDQQARKIHNSAKELKVVEYVIALLIQVFPGSYTS